MKWPMKRDQLTARQIFEFDQAYAHDVDFLRQLIEFHLTGLKENERLGIPEAVSISMFAEGLSKNCDKDTLASGLAVAIDLMSRYAREDEERGG
jgi:hypothetical protein